MDDIGDNTPLERRLPPPPDAGDVLHERYRLVRELGRGGMGRVFEAEHLELGTRVAVKVLLARAYASPKARKRFEIEARNAASLQHPNIIRVFDYGIAQSSPFFVMEYIEGTPLDALCSERSIGSSGHRRMAFP